MAATIVKNDRFVGPIRFGDSGYGEIEPHGSLGPARWDWFDLLCVHRGQITVSLTARTTWQMHLDRGEGLLILPDTPFTGEAQDEGARISVQHFELLTPMPTGLPHALARLHGRRRGVDRVRFLGPPSLEPDIQRAIGFAFTPDRPGLHDARVAQLVLLLDQMQTGEQTATTSTSDPRARDLQRRLQATDVLNDVTPELMAGWVGLSASRFRVWFKGQFGSSPKRYLIHRRVNRAMQRLRETRDPIKQIAADLGYADLPTFYHDFRRHTKTTPAAYREQHTVLG